ncbi:hypothetical protein FIBSPDRAFT_888995 [Athelia psychrophila]|uniref:Carbamoyl phosphate synthase ATP-binding domain-containing protein n=1 Tax=Athelia psychrophila TaxID=1759441 RepID=A0A166MSK9_9AGAM|nr:hypothetical protein FIBSPDRAFT_888995 [Fibularhizoctonia sp. CBS 109695]
MPGGVFDTLMTSVTAVDWIPEALNHAPTLKDCPDTCPKSSSLTTARSRFASSRLCKELGRSAVAVGTSIATLADEAVRLDSPSWFPSPERIVDIIHPGYATRSPHLSSPRPDDQMAHSLARPGNPAHRGGHDALQSAADIHTFVQWNQTPGDDKGAGRGILVVSTQEGGGAQTHVEAQIAGDGMGEVTQVWERACSVQRRFRKLVEMAPSTVTRSLVQLLLASTTMAYAVRSETSRRGQFRILRKFAHWRMDVPRDQSLYCSVGTYFGSLLAMILVRGRDLGEATQQAVRAPRETSVWNEEGGVKTNRAVLAGRGSAIRYGGGCDKDWGGPAQAAGRRIGFTGATRRRRSDRHLDLWERHSISSSPPGSKAAADTKKQIHQTLGPADYLYRLAQ